MQKRKKTKLGLQSFFHISFWFFFTLSEFQSKIHWIRRSFPEIRGLPLVIVATKVLLWALGLLQTPPKATKIFYIYYDVVWNKI